MGGIYNEDKFNDFMKRIKENNSDIKLSNDSNNTLTFEEYKGVKYYYYIKCDICGEYVRKTLDNAINNRNYNCNACASKIIGNKNKLSFKKAIKRVELLNSEMRADLSHPIMESEWNKVIDKYWLKCLKCGKWIFREYRNFVNRGCNLCGDCGGKNSWDIDFAKRKAKELGSCMLSNEWKGFDSLYEFKCSRCNDKFTKQFDKFLLNTCCRKCNKSYQMNLEEAKEESEKLGTILLSNEFKGINKKYKFKCKNCGREFFKIFSKLKECHGLCQICNASKGEYKIGEFLTDNYIKFQTQYIFSDLIGEENFLRFDFVILDNKNKIKLLIEYQGEQHFKFVNFRGKTMIEEDKIVYKKGLEYDKKKRIYCKNNNIRLLEIPYWEFDNIEEILREEVK